MERKEDMKSNRFWLNNLVSASREQRDPNNMMDFETQVENMTVQDVQAVAQKYLNNDYILAILMPEAE